MEVITKAELGRELGLSKGRVSQLVKAGLPVLPNGRVDRAAAISWYRAGIRPRMLKPGPRRPPNTLANTSATRRADALSTGRWIVDLLRSRASELPALLLALGAPVAAAVAVPEIFDLFLEAAVGEQYFELFDGPDEPAAIPVPPTEVIARAAGVRVGVDIQAEADRLLDRADAFFGLVTSEHQ